MAFSNEPLSPPDVDDFQRMGLRRMEFRPPIIRRALGRSAQPLVLMHLRSPSAQLEKLLVDVMTSGYRVLDPRRRDDSQQRVMLGRIHPQLVDEAVHLAQAKSSGSSAKALSGGSTGAAEAAADGGDGLVGSRLPSEFSPVTERDWLEAAEPMIDAVDRLVVGGGKVPELTSSDRFLDLGSVPMWGETLSGSDLMVESAYWQFYRAVRRRLTRASRPSIVSATLLAASVLLVLTWRTTAWLRSGDQRQATAELMASAASSMPGLALPAFSGDGVGSSVAPSVPAAVIDGKPSEAAIAGVVPMPADVVSTPGQSMQGNERPIGAGVNDANEPGVQVAGNAVSSNGVPSEPRPAHPLATDQSTVATVPQMVPVAGAADGPVVGAAAGTAADMASASPNPEKPLAGTTGASVVVDPAAVGGPALDELAAKEAADARAAADELGTLELLGLEGSVALPGNAMAEATPVQVQLPGIPNENLFGSARLRVEKAARELNTTTSSAAVTTIPGAVSIASSSGVKGATAFRKVAATSPEGSPERYVGTLLAGQSAVMAGNSRHANRAIVDLTQWFQIDRDAATIRLARWMAADVTNQDELRRVATWLDGQLRAAMIAGELSLASELVGVTQEVGLRHRDDAMKADAKLWRDVLIISQRYEMGAKKVADDPSAATVEERGLAGRYWALVCRDWHQALPFLAACETPKLTRLAGIELLAGQTIDVEDANTLADGYLGEGKKAKGWLGESYIVRSHEVLTAAAGRATVTEALELNRRASDLVREYPGAFVSYDDRIAADEKGGGEQFDSAPSGTAATPSSSATGMVPDRGPPQMLGRMRIGGEDLGALIRYQPGMPLSQQVVDQIRGGLSAIAGRSLADIGGKSIEFEFVGTLIVDRPKTITLHLSASGPGGSQVISFDGTDLPNESVASMRAPKRFEIDVLPGEYLIRWSLTLIAGDQLSLRVVDEATGKSVQVFNPPASLINHPESLPTQLRVGLMTAE